MKRHYLILFFVTILSNTYCQDTIFNSMNWETAQLARIIDKDGYTNVREYANAKSDSIDNVKKDELFVFIPNDTSNWVVIHKYWNTYGYIHKSIIEPIDSLTDSLKNNLCYTVLSQHLEYLKLYQNNNRKYHDLYIEYHENYYIPILPISVELMISTKNDTLIGKFIEIIALSTGSADETQFYQFARLFTKLPETIFKKLKSIDSNNLNQYLIDGCEMYFGDDYLSKEEKLFLTNNYLMKLKN